MNTSARLRNIAFVIMMGAGVGAMDTGLLASYSIEDCAGWDGTYDCTCNDEEGSWSGQCDFSQSSDPLGLANEFCADTFGKCIDTCEGDYFEQNVDAKVEEECPVFDPCDPACYEECWIAFAGTNGCNAGEESDFSCGCEWFNWCEGC
jgi:hypothetical protein